MQTFKEYFTNEQRIKNVMKTMLRQIKIKQMHPMPWNGKIVYVISPTDRPSLGQIGAQDIPWLEKYQILIKPQANWNWQKDNWIIDAEQLDHYGQSEDITQSKSFQLGQKIGDMTFNAMNTTAQIPRYLHGF